MRKPVLLALVFALSMGSGSAWAGEVIPVSEVDWQQLNPARGDQSPKAGTLWGDRQASTATGFLVEFVDGFSSPPHIHNVSYRGVVISGLIHNDDPAAASMWMPTGSFWTQPKGEAHITAAKGVKNVAYIEIEDGPYLVRPVADAYDSGERPVNVDASNIVWLDPLAKQPVEGVRTAYLWGSPREGRLHGSLLELPSGFDGVIESEGPGFRAVVITGQLAYRGMDDTDSAGSQTLDPGSLFSSDADSKHPVACRSNGSCILYVRAQSPPEVAAR